MPLPDESEQAAATVAAILAGFDRALIEHIETGAPVPNLPAIVADVRWHVTRSVRAALRESDPDVTAAEIRATVEEIVAPIRDELAAQARQARRVRKSMPRRPPEDPGDPTDTLIDKVGAAAAFLLLVARLPRRRRRDLNMLRRVMVRAGLNAPRPTAAYARMVVRTETARARNDAAANVAEERGQIIFLEDSRRGDFDEPCVFVNGKYATPAWLRANRTEHPNCTRRGRPVNRPLRPVNVLGETPGMVAEMDRLREQETTIKRGEVTPALLRQRAEEARARAARWG